MKRLDLSLLLLLLLLLGLVGCGPRRHLASGTGRSYGAVVRAQVRTVERTDELPAALGVDEARLINARYLGAFRCKDASPMGEGVTVMPGMGGFGGSGSPFGGAGGPGKSFDLGAD